MGTVLVRSSEVSGNGRTGLLVKIRNAGMQGQEFLRSLWILKANLAPFLLSGRPMEVLDTG